MKQPKQRKPRHKLLILLLLVLGCVAVLATGTYAAYTEYKTVKRVVVARTREDFDGLRFSSNLLFVYELNDDNYEERSISVSSSGDVRIDLMVCNYPQSAPASFNDSDIRYTMSINIIAEGTDITFEPQKGFLEGGKLSSVSHSITIPADAVSAVSSGYLTVVVTPDEDSREATMNKKLAANLKIVPKEAAPSGWSGAPQFEGLSEKNDAINYYIHGTEECDMVLSWDQNKVKLGQWSRESLDVKESTDNSVTIHVGGPGQPTSYYLQFYRLAPAKENETADSLGILFTKGS